LDLFHHFVCKSGQTLQDLETLLAEALSSMMLPARQAGHVELQPDYMDAIRRSVSGDPFRVSNVRKVMQLVYQHGQCRPSESDSQSLSDILVQRLKSGLFDEISECSHSIVVFAAVIGHSI
jgi:hypothetical protein